MASGVPKLETHLGLLDSHVLGLEATTNSGVVVGDTSGELVDKSGLTDSKVAQKHDLGEELFTRIAINHLRYTATKIYLL